MSQSMNKEAYLQHIIAQLREKRLTKEQAMELLKNFREQGEHPVVSVHDQPDAQSEHDLLLIYPNWQELKALPHVQRTDYQQHLVFLVTSDEALQREIAGLLPDVRCVTLLYQQQNLAESFSLATLYAFEEIQQCLKQRSGDNVLVQVVIPQHPEQQLFQGLVGLLKTARLESTRFTGQLILLPEGEIASEIVSKLRHHRRYSGNEVLRYQDSICQELIWSELVSDATAQQPWHDGGVYLITGGTGGLGRIFAEEIARTCKDVTLLLVGQSALSAAKRAQVAALERYGAKVEFWQVNITARAEVTYLAHCIQQQYGRLDGIIHGAGIIRDNFLLKKSREEWLTVLGPKVTGLVNLDEATGSFALDFFLLHSSGAGAQGNIGQADYATANAFMDAYVVYRNGLVDAKQRFGRTLSINWPLWQEGGMRLDDEAVQALWQEKGILPLATADGIRAVWQGFASSQAQCMVLSGNAQRLRSSFTQRQLASPPLVTPDEHLSVDTKKLYEKTLHQLKLLFSEKTHRPVSQLDAQENLEHYGIDSIIIMRLTRSLNTIFGEVSATLFYEYRTFSALTNYLVTNFPTACAKWVDVTLQAKPVMAATTQAVLSGQKPDPKAQHAKPIGKSTAVPATRSDVKLAPTQHTHEPIAIVGLVGRYPGANTLDEYWENLKAGRDSISEVPEERWSLEHFYHANRQEAIAQGKSYSKWGGFLQGFANFDAAFFNIAPREAFNIDPQERLFLQECWKVLEDAGYTRERLATVYQGQVGVFAGITKSGFRLYGAENWQAEEQFYPRTSFSSVANRVSYFLDLHGPSLSIDTMCSASLVAIHEACEHIRRGECQMAIAGGVNLYLHPSEYIHLCQSNMLSEDGQCRSFGQDAHGFAPGEGVGCVLLKPLSLAIQDGDQIYAVIRGTRINHGGKTTGYTVPNLDAQRALVRQTLAQAGINARMVSYLEAHGTGTELGDPIEITALTHAFRTETSDTQFCAIGSVKSNLGHLESASGIAGLTKILLQMKHRMLVPSLHAQQLNQHIKFEQTPFFVQQTLTPWNRPQVEIDGNLTTSPRIAGLSSFGAGGTNVHIVLEEYISEAMPRSSANADGTHQPMIIPLSARTPEQLRNYVEALLRYIRPIVHTADPDAASQEFSLANLAYTFQVGREMMEYRLGFVTTSVADLADKLSNFLAGNTDIDGVYQNQRLYSKEMLAFLAHDEILQEAIQKWYARGDYTRLLLLWVNSVEVQWQRLYKDKSPRIISAPTYPFAQDRYWLRDLITERPQTSAIPALPATTSSSIEQRRVESQTQKETIVEEAPPPIQTPFVSISLSEQHVITDEMLEQAIKEAILHSLSIALIVDEDEIDVNVSFVDYGLDSILGIKFVNYLNQALSIELEVSVIFDYSSVNAMAAYILSTDRDVIASHLNPEFPATSLSDSPDMEELTETVALSVPPPDAIQSSEKGELTTQILDSDPIAIIGISGRFPKSRTADELWQHLANGADLTEEVTRWSPSELTSDANGTYCHSGSFLDDIDLFDPFFFNISGVEATHMDPQQRIFLEEAWKALEDAGYADVEAEEKKTGVYTGSWAGDYQALLPDRVPAQALWGNMGSVIPSRIAYFLNLHGPAISVDTSCSSSLVAIHLACQDLRSHQTDMALAGGVFVQSTPRLYLSANQAGMLSSTGHCHSFDRAADGFVPGEGVGVIVLKRLSEAQAAGDHIYGVITGSGINQDGTTNGITAPSANSQQRLLHSVYDTFGINPEHIQLVEAHGTGTKLGDPLEFQALARTFRDYTTKEEYCALGSVKANLGHAQFAAGITSVIKVLLSLKYQQIPPSSQFTSANPAIQLEGSPFYINTQLKAWDARPDTPRCAVVTALGASGTNAHLVIEEAPLPTRQPLTRPAYLIVLSARSDEQLRQQVEHLCSTLHQRPRMHLGDVSYTLLRGRKHVEHRLACIARTVEEVQHALQTWLRIGQAPKVFVSTLTGKRTEHASLKRAGNQALQRCSSMLPAEHANYLDDLSCIATCYVQGYTLDYAQLFALDTCSRVSLPTYPFARERYWVSRSPATTAQLPSASVAVKDVEKLHPLVHRNTSTLSIHRYTSTFSGQEFFLRDHVVNHTLTMPAVAYLEMARAALVQACDTKAHVSGLRIEHIAWVRPLTIVAEQPLHVDIVLSARADNRIAYEIRSVSDGTEPGVHSQGIAQITTLPALEPIDLAALRAACQTQLAPNTCYAALQNVGIAHGSTLQALNALFAGQGQVLARLTQPAREDTTGSFVLDLAMMDAAIQAATGLKLATEDRLEHGDQPALPFALERLEVYGSCSSTMWAWVRYGTNSAAGEKVEKLDIDLCDDTGTIQVRMHGYSSRILSGKPRVAVDASSVVENVPMIALLKPTWDTVTIAQERSDAEASTGRALICGGTDNQRAMLQQFFPVSSVLTNNADMSHDALVRRLSTLGTLSQLIWIAPSQEDATGATFDAFIATQKQGVLSLFRLIKALLRLGYDAKTLSLTVITNGSFSIHAQDKSQPAHASVHGFVGSLAKEYPHWHPRLVDLPLQEEWPLSEIFALPDDHQGLTWCYRQGQWYRQGLVPFRAPATVQTAYRSGGVYLVIGGAGGLGEVWSEYMIRTYQAQVVWLGRRSLDETIRTKLERLAQWGPAPLYLSGDATDLQALQQVRATIKARYGRLDGLVNSAIVLRDKILANMDEERFHSALAAKVDVSVRIAQVFGSDDLDFMLFFSSIQSYARVPGQSNYAAGSTFEDAFAQWLAQYCSSAVKVMNWGYWGSVGVASSPFYRQRMAQGGMGSIEAPEGMRALETLIGSSASQLSFVSLTKTDVLPGINLEAEIVAYEEEIPLLVSALPDLLPDQVSNVQSIKASLGTQHSELEVELCRLLWALLQSMQVFSVSHGSLMTLRSRSGIQDLYDRWLTETIRVLVNMSYLSIDGTTYTVLRTEPVDVRRAWQQWDQRKKRWLDNPHLKAQVALVDATLHALPAVLTGQKAATEIMFPNASMALVEGVYKNNLVADYFNQVLTDTLESYLQERLRQDPAARIRILEVGAGTGGTSAMIFPRLRPYQEHIEEYCYTDLSRAFLLHAERTYGAQNPFLRYEILNVEQPLSEQKVPAASYDIAIATNVMHATSDIRRSLRTIKAALKRNGVLLLNELSRGDLFNHLTFGLLKGWWLYEDAALRIPGSPGLYPQSWQQVLASEGFQTIVFATPTAHELGQQIIVAESDGLVRLQSSYSISQTFSALPQTITAVKIETLQETQITEDSAEESLADHAGMSDQNLLREKCTAYLLEIFSETLNVPLHKLDPAVAMVQYGMDSILALSITNLLREQIGDISNTILFECETIADVVEQLIAIKKVELMTHLEVPAGTEKHLESAEPFVAVPSPDAETVLSSSASEALTDCSILLQETGERIVSPLSQGQLGLWILYQYASSMSPYNVPFAFSIKRPLELEAFQKACRFLLKQYPLLGSIFGEEDGAPRQIIPEVRSISYEQEQIDRLEREEIVPYLMQKVRAPFQLDNGPLIRMQLFFYHDHLSGELETFLLITVHHIILDAVTAVMLITALWNAYRAYCQGNEPESIVQQTTYHDFVLWEQSMMTGEKGHLHLDYWKQQLSGDLPVLALPIDHPRPAFPTFKGSIHKAMLEPSMVQQIKSVSKAKKVTPAVLFLAIYEIFLYIYSGQEDLIVGLPSIGRPERRFEKVPGYFVNMIAIRQQLIKEQNFVDFLRAINTKLSQGLSHAAYPFPALVKELQVNRDTIVSPIFQTLYAYQTFQRDVAAGMTDADLQITFLEGIYQEGAFDFTLEVFESKDNFELNFKYGAELFESATIEKMMDHLLVLIQRVVSDPDQIIVNYVPTPDSYLIQSQEQPYVAPRNALEELFVDLWHQTLGVSRVGIYDNFFQLGGNSERGAQIIARAQQFGLHFTMSELTHYPTVADLIEHFLLDKTQAQQVKRLTMLLKQLKKQKQAEKQDARQPVL